MRPTRRSVLKSGVAGLVAAAGTASKGVTQEGPLHPGAVISITVPGVYPTGTPGEYFIAVNVAVSVQGFSTDFSTTLSMASFNFNENISKNINVVMEAIETHGGPTLQAADLVFIGFDLFRG